MDSFWWPNVCSNIASANASAVKAARTQILTGLCCAEQ